MEEWLLLLLAAVFATAGHYFLTLAFQSAELSALQPFSFLQLVWATLLGLVVFSEQPDLWLWLGAGVIVFSATWIGRQEVRSSRGPPDNC